MNLPKFAHITEVAPRDGLQSLPEIVPTDRKAELIGAIRQAGIRKIEITSFVHPKWVPQLADAEDLLGRVEAPNGVIYQGLVANEKGYDRARQCPGITEVHYVIAATESLNRKNANMSIAESMAQFLRIIERARDDRLPVRASIGVSFVCPYEKFVSEDAVIQLAREFVELGAGEVAFADTIGAANPARVHHLLARARDLWPDRPLGIHLHDTRHMALANAFAALQAGIDRFDSSIGGLGGCPFSPGASGNIATERLVHMLHEMEIDTGIDYDRLKESARFAQSLLHRT